MYKQIIIKTCLIIGIISATGCAYDTSNYGASVQNVDAIKAAHIKPVAVADFSSVKPGENTIMCRAAGPVTSPVAFETYVKNAFIDELKLAGAYDPSSPNVIQGKLDKIDFDSNVGTGEWQLDLSVSSKNNTGFTANSAYSYSSNFVADKACQQTAQAFAPAVQNLINQVVTNEQFKTLAQ